MGILLVPHRSVPGQIGDRQTVIRSSLLGSLFKDRLLAITTCLFWRSSAKTWNSSGFNCQIGHSLSITEDLYPRQINRSCFQQICLSRIPPLYQTVATYITVASKEKQVCNGKMKPFIIVSALFAASMAADFIDFWLFWNPRRQSRGPVRFWVPGLGPRAQSRICFSQRHS